MGDYRDALLSRAFKRIPGVDYNRFAYELREKTEDSSLLYEVVLKENDSWEELRDRVYPTLARYLKAKGMDPSSGEGLIVAVFFKDSVYLLTGKDFIKTFCEMEGLNLSAFSFRVLRWLST